MGKKILIFVDVGFTSVWSMLLTGVLTGILYVPTSYWIESIEIPMRASCRYEAV